MPRVVFDASSIVGAALKGKSIPERALLLALAGNPLPVRGLRAVIGAYHHCVVAAVERAGGFVAKHVDDGLLPISPSRRPGTSVATLLLLTQSR